MAKETTLATDTFTCPVEVPLTDRELLAYADELTTLDTEQKEIEHRHQSEKGAFKADMERLDQRQGVIMDRLRTKKEYKDIECYNDFNYFEGICEVRRVDNDDVIKTRKMTVDEFKEKLPFPSDDDDDENLV